MPSIFRTRASLFLFEGGGAGPLWNLEPNFERESRGDIPIPVITSLLHYITYTAGTARCNSRKHQKNIYVFFFFTSVSIEYNKSISFDILEDTLKETHIV